MHLTRRTVIKASLALAACSLAPSLGLASRSGAARALHFHNTHTGESLKTVYWEKGAYNPGALKEIAHVLRDHRTNEIHPIDTRLLDLLTGLHRRIGSTKPFEVISGYRSARSNIMLQESTSGVATLSQHLLGKAIDVRLADRPLAHLRDMAWDMQKGGVGYYPASDFVHLDTGKVRRW